jgi:hypothetical protein
VVFKLIQQKQRICNSIIFPNVPLAFQYAYSEIAQTSVSHKKKYYLLRSKPCLHCFLHMSVGQWQAMLALLPAHVGQWQIGGFFF